MSSDVSAQAQANAVAREDLKLGCFPDGHHSDLSLSPSPDSTSSNLSRSDHESRISPDCDMQLIGRKGSSHLDNKLTPSLADNVFHNKHLNLNQTFISTPINGRDCWNANLCRPASADILNENVFGSLERAKTYSESAEQGSEDGSYASSHKAENDYCSMSSGGMILRTNSFCLADQSAPVVSSLDESCHLEDQMENSNHLSHDGPQQSNATVSGLGMTFIQEENCSPQTEKEDMNCDDCLVVLPSEDECLLQRTFFVSDTPSDKSFETPPAHGTLSPEEVKTLVYTMTAAKDAEDVHTSTPVQNIGNKTASLPDFLESPCMDQQKLPEPLPNDPCFEENKDKKETKKPNLSNLRSKVLKKPAQKTAMTTPAKLRPVQLSVKSKNIEISKGAVNRGKSSVSDPPRQVNAGSSGVTITSKCTNETQSFLALDASSRECIPVSSVAPQTATAQDLDSLAQGHGNQTFCLSVLEISSRQIEPQPKSKKSLLDRIKVRTGSTTSPDVPPVPKMRPRGSSDSSLFSKATKEKKTFRLSSTFSFPRNDKNQLKAKPGNKISSGNKAASPGNYLEKPGQSSSIVVKKNSLVAESSRAAAVEGESSGHGAKRAPLSQPTPATTKPIPLPTTLRLANCVKTESRSSKPTSAVQAKQTSGTGVQKTPISRASSVRTASTSTKPSLNRLRAPQGPASHSSACFTSTPGSKLPRPGPRQSQTLDSGHNKRVEGAVGSQVSTGGAAPKQTPFKAMKNVFLRAKLTPTPAKPNRATSLSTSVASAKKGLSNSTEGPQRRTSTSRLVRLTPSKHVDKKTTKASTRPQQATQNNGPPDVVPSDLVEDERKERLISQLKDDLAAKNLSFEAITVVLKQSLTERDEATRQRREQSQELVTLRGELVSSVHSAERLEKEKEDVQRSLEEALHDVQEQHRKDLDEVEKRVRAFYQVEWDKVHLTYQEEADKCKARMQEQLAELQAQHEAMKQELEMSHTHQLRCFKQQYEASLEELRKVHSQELESLDRTVKEAEAALSGQIQQLSEENKVLQQKLTAEEGRRKKLSESSQKDSRTVYLEQELESLKVVLDIKTKQLHQQEKKLMEIDKLTEKNVKLDESLKKVQQENEDLKARMERHAALSRQLSTDQAMLQQTLQKESKVNKRLSMENEELLWKLNNGELNSPHRVSPSSPSHSFNLQSPCRSNIFSSPSVSPR